MLVVTAYAKHQQGTTRLSFVLPSAWSERNDICA